MKDYKAIKDISLREYFEYKGWWNKEKNAPKTGTVTAFANRCEVSIAYISKLVNNQYVSMKPTNYTFLKIKGIVDEEGFNLVKGNFLENANNAILKDNDKVKEENKRLKKEIEFLKKELEDLKEVIKLCKKISMVN